MVLLREVTTDLAMLERLVAPAGKDVLDVGCGDGALVRALAARGARVIGLEVSDSQLARALARDDHNAARYLVGRAQALPLEDASVDLTVFMRTLHHVPAADLIRALREACRVLRTGGAVYVAEPLPEGDYFALTSLVEDELEVRRAAENALAGAALAGLDRLRSIEYEVQVRIADLGALCARIVSVDPNRADAFDANEGRLAEAFAQLGEEGEQAGERSFLQPMRADLLLAADA